jgi:hypothetical protein
MGHHREAIANALLIKIKHCSKHVVYAILAQLVA